MAFNYNVAILKPGINDIICGRGHANKQHLNPGNRYFHALIEKYHIHYGREKALRKKLVEHVIATIRSLKPPGRFVTKDLLSERLVEVDSKRVTRKV